MNPTAKVQVIKDDQTLLLILQTLFAELKKRVRKQEFVWFPPERIKVAEGGKRKKPRISFQAESIEDRSSSAESIRLLGVTLYHLNRGESELNAECFMFDGYITSMDSVLWPLVRDLANGKLQSVEEADKELQKKVEERQTETAKSKGGGQGSVSPIQTSKLIQRISSEIKIITPEQAASVWNKPVPQNTQLRYSEQTIQECIEDNQRNGADWRLIYALGLSLREQRNIQGTDTDNQPCFYDNGWWLDGEKQNCEKKSIPYWAAQSAEPGYYLLNFNGQFGDKIWQKQNELIAQLGPNFTRAPETIVAEACLSTFLLTNERLLKNWYHWGSFLGSGRGRVGVGEFGSGGFGVRSVSPIYSDSFLRVVLARKFLDA